MSDFFNTIFSFPTAMFTIFLGLVVVYWGIAALGILDIDSLDIDVDSDVLPLEGFSGLLLKFGLHGVPITIVFTFLSVISWFFCYFGQLLLLNRLSLGFFNYILAVLVALLAIVIAIPVSALLCRLLRPFFRKMEATSVRTLLGQTVTVRSVSVTPMHGEAALADGGAGLILKIRAEEAQGFKRGDKVILLEYLEDQHAYRVISEDEFNGF